MSHTPRPEIQDQQESLHAENLPSKPDRQQCQDVSRHTLSLSGAVCKSNVFQASKRSTVNRWTRRSLQTRSAANPVRPIRSVSFAGVSRESQAGTCEGFLTLSTGVLILAPQC